jgi:hypothetical protein
MLLVGLVVGALVRDERTLRRSVLLGAAASLLWGISVGVGAGSLLIVVAGTAIGLANVAAGALVGWGLRSALRSIGEHTQPRAPSQ